MRRSTSGPTGSPPRATPAPISTLLRAQALDAFGTRYAICNVLHGAQAIFSEDLSAAFCRAINDWLAAEWLSTRRPRCAPPSSCRCTARNSPRRKSSACAADPRFVQVLVWEMGELPLGRRQHWPIYRAAERLDLPIGIHAGSSYRHPPTNLGWPSYYLEDYVSWSTGFAGVLNSLISEGVFVEFPRLKVVLMESGVTWLPGWMWRADKTWRGVRAEVPWLEKSPADYAREHVRLTVAAVRRAAATRDQLQRIIEEIGSDEMLLFSTDYPHWHFDGNDALPAGLPDALVRKIWSTIR